MYTVSGIHDAVSSSCAAQAILAPCPADPVGSANAAACGQAEGERTEDGTGKKKKKKKRKQAAVNPAGRFKHN